MIVVMMDYFGDAVSFGYKTVDEYYFASSSSRSIKDVKVPLLCIQVLCIVLPVCHEPAIYKNSRV